MKFLYPEFKSKAATFSYDDGTTQDRRLIEIFKKYGIKATFNLNSSRLGNKGRINHFDFDLSFDIIAKEEVSSLYEGFEVATHGYTHPFFSKLNDSEFDFEIGEDIRILSELAGYKVTGHAYPCGDYDDRTIERFKMHGITYARTIKSTFGFEVPEEFLAWHPTCHDRDTIRGGMVEKFLADDSELSLLYVWGHSFEFDKTDFDRWANIEQACKMLSGRDEIWLATNGEICDYITAVRAAKEANNKINPTETTLYFEQDGKRFIWKSGSKPKAE